MNDNVSITRKYTILKVEYQNGNSTLTCSNTSFKLKELRQVLQEALVQVDNLIDRTLVKYDKLTPIPVQETIDFSDDDQDPIDDELEMDEDDIINEIIKDNNEEPI